MLTDAEINDLVAKARAFLTAVDALPAKKRNHVARQWAANALKCAEAAAQAQARYMALACPALPPPALGGDSIVSPRMEAALNVLKTIAA